MEHPTIVLGVEMMDQDHLRIEKMFEAASHKSWLRISRAKRISFGKGSFPD